MNGKSDMVLGLCLGAALGLGLGCGPRTAAAREEAVQHATELVMDGGLSPFQGRLAFKAPEAMAIQEVPFWPDADSAQHLEEALNRYRGQWTLQLTIGPKASAKVDPSRPLDLDIENNGGMWGDRSRNLRRLTFEMQAFIRLRLANGKELEPVLVEFQRNFGMGLNRSFVIVFPKSHEGKPIQPPFQLRVAEFGQGTGTFVFDVTHAPDEMALWRVKQLWKASGVDESK